MNLGYALKNKIVLCAFLIPLLFVYSCYRYQNYPDEWAPLQSPISECIDISGSYYNQSEKTIIDGSEYYGPFLTKLFQVPPKGFYYSGSMFDDQIDLISNIGVQIELISNDKIKIIARYGDILVYERVIDRSRDDFKCTSGMIKISGPSDYDTIHGGGGAAIKYEGESYYFSKSTDGALILKSVESQFLGCCIGLGPFAFWHGRSSWYFYKPVVDKKTKHSE